MRRLRWAAIVSVTLMVAAVLVALVWPDRTALPFVLLGASGLALLLSAAYER